jgi:hypothetical protein
MDIDPIVVEVKPPKTPFKLPFKMPQFGNRSTKIITIVSAVVIIVSIIIFAVFTTLVNNDTYRKKQNIVTATDEIRQNASPQVLGAAIPGNSEVQGKGGTSGTNAPVVTLSASQGSVQKGSKVTLKWSTTNNPKSCVASDDWSGAKPTSGSESSSNLTQSQTYMFTLTCKTDTGTGYATVSVSVIEQSGSGVVGQPVVHISAADSQVFVGQKTSITWDASNNPSSCVASGDWSGTKAASGSVTVGPLTAVKQYSFALKCTNSAGYSQVSIPVSAIALPPDVPVVSLDFNPAGPIDKGTSATLIWSATNSPSSCSASGDWSGTKATSGSQSITFNTVGTFNYKLDCTNSGGTQYEIASITVVNPPPSITSFTASPTSVYTGSSSTLSWAVANNTGATCSASGDWSGTKASGASNSASTGALNTAKTYTYSLTCTNSYGSSATKTASVTASVQPAPVVTLIADSYSVTAGGSTNIRWSSTNSPSSCTASGSWSGAKSTTGTTTSNVVSTGALGAGSYTYNLSCTNSNPTPGTATITITSSSGPASNPPVITISLSPTTIATGASSTLSWSVANTTGTSCTASNAWTGAQGLSGTTSTGVKGTAGTFTYTLTCSNSAGSDTKSAVLTVNSLPTAAISLSATTAETGTSVTLTWSSTNTSGATPCTASGGWSGTKAASGSTAITVPAPASPTSASPTGTTTYTVTCTNASGSANQSVTLTSAYCYQGGSVRTPCYGPTTMATHATAGACWNYWTNTTGTILTKVYNIASFNSVHSGKGSVTLNTTALCGNKPLNWSLPGYPSNSKHNSVIQNNSQGTLNGYAVGYYDANSPN